MEVTDPKLKDYYHSVWKTYNAWYDSYGESPTMKIDLGKYDFVNNDDDRNIVLNDIEENMVRNHLLTPDQFRELQAHRN